MHRTHIVPDMLSDGLFAMVPKRPGITFGSARKA